MSDPINLSACSTVHNTPELLEIIVKNAVVSSDSKQFLQKTAQNLFETSLNCGNTIKRWIFSENKVICRENKGPVCFIETIPINSVSAENHLPLADKHMIPPICVQGVIRDSLCVHSLRRVLTSYGDSIVKLNFYIEPVSKGRLPNIKLANLTHLVLAQGYPIKSTEELLYVQDLLDAANRCLKLELHISVENNFKIPASVINLRLQVDKAYRILGHNIESLTNLRHLVVKLTKNSSKNSQQVWTSVFTACSETLERLELQNCDSECFQSIPVFVETMKCVKVLKLVGQNWALNSVGGFENFVTNWPVLKELTLNLRWWGDFGNWMSINKTESVDKLVLEFANQTQNIRLDLDTIPCNLFLRMPRNFPKLTSLNMTVGSIQSETGIKCILNEMTGLKTLSLEISKVEIDLDNVFSSIVNLRGIFNLRIRYKFALNFCLIL